MSKRAEAREKELRAWIATLERQRSRAKQMVDELTQDINASSDELTNVMLGRIKLK